MYEEEITSRRLRDYSVDQAIRDPFYGGLLPLERKTFHRARSHRGKSTWRLQSRGWGRKK